jgi:hypothetical protein
MTAAADLSCVMRAGKRIEGALPFRLCALACRVASGFGVALRCSAGFVSCLRYGHWVGTARTGRGWRAGNPGAGILAAGIVSAGVLSARGDLVADRAAR